MFGLFGEFLIVSSIVWNVLITQDLRFVGRLLGIFWDYLGHFEKSGLLAFCGFFVF